MILIAIGRAWMLLSKNRVQILAFILGIACTLAVVEITTAGLLFRLLQTLDNPSMLPLWPFLRWHFDELTTLSLLTMGVYTLLHLLTWAEGCFQNYLLRDEVSSLIVERCTKLIHLSHDKLEATLATIQKGFIKTLSSLASLSANLIKSLCLIGLLLFLMPVLTFSLIVGCAGFLLVFTVFLQQRSLSLDKALTLAHKTREAALRSLLSGQQEIQLAGREKAFVTMCALHEERLWQLESKRDSLLSPASHLLFGAILAIVVIYLSRQAFPAPITLLGVYVYTLLRLAFFGNRIQQSLHNISKFYPALEELKEVLESPKPLLAKQEFPLLLTHHLNLQEVCYHPALRHIDLTLNKGDWVGILGAPKSGKSALAQLVVGLLVPQTGLVCVDGTNIQGTLKSWQAQVGYVPQSIHLLADTLAANIYFGAPIEDRERLYQVIQLAHLEDLISQLPMGAQALLDVARLGPEVRQRIGIARALYSDPEVLVLDEATTGLSAALERKLLETLSTLKKTILMTASRMSSVARCNRLLLLREGELITIHTHKDLFQYQAEFQELIPNPELD